MESQNLEVDGIIAFDGITKNALRLHPDEKHLLYPMGYKVVIRNIETGQQDFLSGHTNNISALCVSSCGEYVASGQNNHLGFKAMVILWNYKERTIRGSYEMHKVGVEDLCFTCNSDFLVSLGGRDDGNVIVWDVRSNSPICGSLASNETSGDAYNIARMHIHGECFVTAGDRTMKIWRIDIEKRRAHGTDVEVGKLKRLVNCIVVDEKDEIVYCGTSSGDIVKARLNLHGEPAHPPVMIGCYSKITRDPKKMKTGEGDLYAGGVRSLLLVDNKRLVVGGGDGTVELIEIINKNGWTRAKPSKFPNTPQIFTHHTENVCSAVTTMVLHLKEFVLVGTAWCEIYRIQLSNFHMRLLVTCHTGCVYTIAFPSSNSEVFATGGKNDIRLWKLDTQKEIIRISVPNFDCSCVEFACNDQTLLSAWSDGTIRAFAPHNGRLHFAIHNAHTKAVSTVAITSDSGKLISGGCDGQVRIWEIKADVQRLICTLKEHRGPITSLYVSHNDKDLISSSTDGTCVIWDIIRCARKHVLMSNTMFMAARFTPDGIQILTCGTDRKIAYWETLDCSLVREIEGSSVGTMNCLDICPDGRHFVTGSNDCIVKIWEYDGADVTHVGILHAAIITACKISPDSRYVVTASADGAIMIWKYPHEARASVAPMAAISRDNSVHGSRDEAWNKLSLRESNGSAADQTAQFANGSARLLCTNGDRKQSSKVASNWSKGSKKEAEEERISIYKSHALERSAKCKSNVSTSKQYQCNNAKSDVSSDRIRVTDELKGITGNLHSGRDP